MDETKKTAAGRGLAIWVGDEHILIFLFAIRLEFQPTNKARL